MLPLARGVLRADLVAVYALNGEAFVGLVGSELEVSAVPWSASR